MALKDYRIGTLRYYWPMSAHASQVFSMSTVPIRKIYPWLLLTMLYFYFSYSFIFCSMA